MKKISEILNRQIFIWLVLFVITIPVLLPLTHQGFFPTQDYIYVARLYEMDRAIKDGQFPVRWAPDFRYGEPLFNFYAPLPYYVGSAVKAFNFSYLESIKILIALSFFLSAVTMFYLAREFFGKIGGLVAATLYLYAPYHSVDVYVRGALSEGWSLIFLPLIFLSSYKLIKQPTITKAVLFALSLAGLFFTHNIMSVLFMPFAIGWIIFLLILNKRVEKRILLYVTGGIVLGFGLASTYLLPAFFEKQFVQSQYLLAGYFNFRGHFVAFPQWFSTFWGYGASLWGPVDGMSFQVGLVQWAILALSLFLAVLKRNKFILLLVGFITLEFLFSLFMQHNQSTPIWEAFSILAFVQFPWRFLSISIFLISLVGGSLVIYAPKRLQLLFALGIVIITIYFNVGYFHPESYYLDSIDSHYISAETLSKDDRLPKDYLPIWVKKIEPVKITEVQVKNGQAVASNFSQKTSSAQFTANVDKESEFEIPITYFPGWTIRANGKIVNQIDPGEVGLIKFILPPGNYQVNAEFDNTPIRIIGNVISLLACFLVIYLLVREKRNK